MNVKVYVEGAGRAKTSKSEFRQGLKKFFEKTDLKGRMPRFVCCGGRGSAYADFCIALSNADDSDFIVLLVDSEDPVVAGVGAWSHLKYRDDWDRPHGATDDNANLMVQCMESWFLADRQTLVQYYGDGFREKSLPSRTDVESVRKQDVFRGLDAAIRDSKKGKYHKGNHAFEILGKLNPASVTAGSPNAKRLVTTLTKKASA